MRELLVEGLCLWMSVWCDAAAADVDKTGMMEAEEDEEVPGT